MIRSIILLACLSVAAAVSRATPVTLSRADAHLLYLALNNIQGGLSPQNVAIAADDINALEPTEKSYQAASLAYNRGLAALRHDADAEARSEKLSDNYQGATEALVTVELTPLNLTDDELTATKPPPAVLAPVKRFLNPKPKK